MRDEILEAGTVFDWISPLLAIVQDIIRGPSHTFLIPYDCGWSGRDIARLLESYGVKSWGHMVVERTFMLSVSQNQAQWAHYLLERAGILVENPPSGQPGSGQAQATSRSGPGREPRGLADTLKELLDFRLF
jgi:hypothetical protein